MSTGQYFHPCMYGPWIEVLFEKSYFLRNFWKIGENFHNLVIGDGIVLLISPDRRSSPRTVPTPILSKTPTGERCQLGLRGVQTGSKQKVPYKKILSTSRKKLPFETDKNVFLALKHILRNTVTFHWGERKSNPTITKKYPEETHLLKTSHLCNITETSHKKSFPVDSGHCIFFQTNFLHFFQVNSYKNLSCVCSESELW